MDETIWNGKPNMKTKIKGKREEGYDIKRLQGKHVGEGWKEEIW